MNIQRAAALALWIAILLTIGGCMTVGYNEATDFNMVKKFDVTIIDVRPQNIYDSNSVDWFGPFARVSHVAQRLTVIDHLGDKLIIAQPLSDRYELKAGQRAVAIVSKGHVWVQPTDYPLPSEFGEAKGWVWMDTNGTSTTYADSTSIIRSGNLVKMWTMLDYKQFQEVVGGPPYMSARLQTEYDCDGRRTRVLDASAYTGHMAEGEIIDTDSNPGKWDPVSRGTIGEGIWKFACNKG